MGMNQIVVNPSLSHLSSPLLSCLFAAAYFGTKVYARGIVEFSNVCTKDCFYCGIRKHTKVHRYTMTKEEILACAEFAYSQGMGTLMLQSGELPSPERINFMLDVVRAIRRRTMDLACESPPFPSAGPNQRDFPSQRGLAVALSLGELPSSVYQAFLEAGASRYLLRIETSNPTLYTRLHPASHSFQARRKCLEELQRIGFQVGTGVMVGVPFQTVEDQANDLLFFKELDPDMIGLGPYIVQSQTPLGKLWLEEHGEESAAKQEANRVALLERTTRMYALARIMLGNVNIAATTALEALDPEGRELALRRGANVVMPIITPQRLRGQYEIYENKPGIDQDALDSTACLERRVRMAGKDLLLDGGWHDPPHFVRPSVE
ncbi:radical sam domain protein [Nannochloropsis gaditana]|uniref:Radical sam domain protein n=1 Tax=Nannochloropsis gaditana TaxID=72520 RepID=W7TLH4_9STRA|nr:radical sam domain protein [Nannochloropsis gaditana]